MRHRSQIEIREHYCPDHVTAMVDSVKMRRVVDNLLFNAIKLTPAGGRISICLEQTTSQVVITIRDTGPGIPWDLPERIFDKFAIRPEDGDARGWRVRVIPNKFAALQPRDDLGRRVSGLFRQAPGYGNYEVIIETPRHDQPIPLMGCGHVEDLIRAYRARYLAK